MPDDGTDCVSPEKINEVYEEEQYRHVSGHCSAIENKLLFDRQSLHDRYLKNCQFGVRDALACKVTPVTPLQTAQSVVVMAPPSRQNRERNCFSANAVVDENEVIEDNDEGEGLNDVGPRMLVSRGRSHSAMCHSASLRAYGMTLPDPRPALAPAEDCVKDEGEDTGWDEGYGSKVSSNDQEQDGVEEENLKTFEDGEDPGSASTRKVGPVLQPGSVQSLSHQDAMAKLMYSRREDTVYERLPSRRMRGNSFRYAGREQSRLTEASLSHITPAYLARYHHLADLANAAEAKNSHHDGAEQAAVVQQGVECRSGGGGGGTGDEGALQPRTMVLRKITIQDSARELFAHKLSSSPGGASAASSAKTAPLLGQPFDKIHRRQVLLSPSVARPQRSVSETRPSVSDMKGLGVPDAPQSGKSEPLAVSVQELTPFSRDGSGTTVGSKVSLSVGARGGGDDQQGRSPVSSSPSGPSPAGDNRLTMSTFAMTDLLPAVERNLRFQRSTQRGLTKSRTMDVNATIGNISNRREQPQQQQASVRRLQNGDVARLNGAHDAQGHGRSALNGTTMISKRPPADDVSDLSVCVGVGCFVVVLLLSSTSSSISSASSSSSSSVGAGVATIVVDGGGAFFFFLLISMVIMMPIMMMMMIKEYFYSSVCHELICMVTCN